MKFPLRYQVFLPMASLVVTTVLATSIATASIQGRRTRTEVQRDLQRMAHTLAESTYPLTAPILEQLHGLTGAEFLVTDAVGHLIAASRQVDGPARRGWRPQPADAGDWQSVVFLGQEYFYRVVLLARRPAEQPPQSLHILYPKQAWARQRQAAVFPPLFSGGVGVVVAAISSLFLSRRVTLPIASLSRQMERLANHDYQPVTPPKRVDEIRDLIVAGNQLAARLRDLNEAIRRSERLALLGQLGGGLAHQLRNGVTGARLAIQLHARSCPHDSESIEVALRQLDLVEEQVAGFLALGKQQPRRAERCVLAGLVQEVAGLLAQTCRHRGIVLETKIDEPRAAAWCDRSQIRQLLINLALNAIEASHRGGLVRIVVEPFGAATRLAVYDWGRGVPPQIADKLFDPFATTKPEGIGFGLAVARQIADAHGGRLRYQRQADCTCFELLLPERNSPSATVQQAGEDGQDAEPVRCPTS